MHAQGYVGVLGRVVRGASDIDLGEGNPVGALAGDGVVADRGQAAMARGERTEVVCLVRFQHVGLQQRVLDHTAQLHTVIGEDVAVVL